MMSGSSSSSSSSSSLSVASNRSSASKYALDIEQQNFILQSIHNNSNSDINIRSVHHLYSVILDEYVRHFSSTIEHEHIKHTIRLAQCRNARVKVMERKEEQEQKLYQQLVEQQEVDHSESSYTKAESETRNGEGDSEAIREEILVGYHYLKLHALEALNTIRERERADKGIIGGKNGKANH